MNNYVYKSFVYRYIPLFTHLNVSQITERKQISETERIKYIENTLFHRTTIVQEMNELLTFHESVIPQNLLLSWHIGKSEYSAYFWFEEEPIREVFDKFYGAHPDTKTDFIIRIDAENKKYELALYRYGLKEPQIISEDVYQLLVFKNKFEDYRSDNYNQERGAWIW